MVKLLHIIGSMDPNTGGTYQAVQTSVIEMDKQGVRSEVACLDDPESLFLNQDCFPIHALGPSKGPWCYSPKLAQWLGENLPRFDVAIVHGLWLYHSYAVWKIVRKLNNELEIYEKRLKFFVMPHGMLDPWFQETKGRRLKAIRNWLYWKVIEHRVVNEADGLLFTCETELVQARKPFTPYNPRREINVSFGIQAPPDYQDSMREAFLAKCPDIRNQPYLLFLSRIHLKKGVDMLIEAYASLIKEQSVSQDPFPKLVIAGPGLDTEYGERIQNLVNNNAKLKGLVLFTGMLIGDAKWGALHGCEALILPSHQENFGIAVAEALACAKPVLISNQINIWREIEAGGGGLIADSTMAGTQQLLIQWLNLKHAQKVEMRRRAKNTFRTYFTIELVAEQLKKAITDEGD